MTREADLAQAFIAAADTLRDDFEISDYLGTLAGHCVQLLGVDAAGLMVADHRVWRDPGAVQ
jgi:hypothetical protein